MIPETKDLGKHRFLRCYGGSFGQTDSTHTHILPWTSFNRPATPVQCMHAPSHICELDAQTHEIHSVSLHGIVTPRCGVQSEAWLHPCADSAVGAQTHGRTESHAPVHPCVDSAAVLFFRKMFIKKLISFLCENISLCFMKM